MVRICFVCLGNICRSPTAEGVFRQMLERAESTHAVEVDSAGTGKWHVGEPPDERAQQAARARGYRLSGQARQFIRPDFERFDYVIAMDVSNRDALQRLAPNAEAASKIRLLRDFDPQSPPDSEVPDPYYGEGAGFDRVIDICEAGCRGLLDHLRDAHELGA